MLAPHLMRVDVELKGGERCERAGQEATKVDGQDCSDVLTCLNVLSEPE